MDVLIKIYPVQFKREIIVDFESMKSEMVTIDLRPFAINKYPVTK